MSYFIWLICHVVLRHLSVVRQTKTGYKIYKRDTPPVVRTAKEGEKWNFINSKEMTVISVLCFGNLFCRMVENKS